MSKRIVKRIVNVTYKLKMEEYRNEISRMNVICTRKV